MCCGRTGAPHDRARPSRARQAGQVIELAAPGAYHPRSLRGSVERFERIGKRERSTCARGRLPDRCGRCRARVWCAALRPSLRHTRWRAGLRECLDSAARNDLSERRSCACAARGAERPDGARPPAAGRMAQSGRGYRYARHTIGVAGTTSPVQGVRRRGLA